MEVLRAKYGESSPSGIKAVLAPGNHPKTSDRIHKNLKWMNAYSGRHVEVKDDWIVVNGEKAFSPVSDNAYSQKERLYLTAGKLVQGMSPMPFSREIGSAAEIRSFTSCPPRRMAEPIPRR